LWYLNADDNTQIDLGIRFFDPPVPVGVFWTADYSRFMLTQGPNNGVRVQIVHIQNGRAVVQNLSDLPPLNEFAESFRASAYVAMSLSPDGRYVILQPETADYLMWILDLQEGSYLTLPFKSRGYGVVWDAPLTFVVQTDLGILAYNITDQTYTVIAPLEAFDSHYGTLSPDGRFLARFKYRTNDATYDNSELSVCRVR
jgi:hypothetical protein